MQGLLKHTCWRLCAPIISRGGSRDPNALQEATSIDLTTAGSTAAAPIAINSDFNQGDRTPLALALAAEERRQERKKKMFDDMIVFEGGAIADHDLLGRRMITRDFMHYGLYHRKFGYHPKMHRKYREKMTTGFHAPIPFAQLRGRHDYELVIGKYSESTPTFASPAQLYQPYYGWVIAEYLISVMKAKFHPQEPIVIYDIGAGTGSLAQNILDFLAEHYPEVYSRTEYHLVDIAPPLIAIQRHRLVQHSQKVHIHHMSIHNWRTLETRRCFVLAFELFANFPHDFITWTSRYEVYEQHIQFEQADNISGVKERWFECTDPLILRYLRYSQMMQEQTFANLKLLCQTDGLTTVDRPLWDSLECQYRDNILTLMAKTIAINDGYRQMWVPTGQMVFLEVLAEFFPRHHALFADWNSVQDGVAGYNGPVIQAKVRVAPSLWARRVSNEIGLNCGTMDVCFPTDFLALETVYRNICGPEKEISNMQHPNFWKTFGGSKTALFRTTTGFNPLLEEFDTFQFFASHHPTEL